MLLFSLIPLIALIPTLTTENGAMAASIASPTFKFGILDPPQTAILKLDEEEYRSILDELLRRDNESGDNDEEDAFSERPFLRDSAAQQKQQGILGGSPRQVSILDATYMLAGRSPMVNKRFNRIGGNIMMGRK
uniref:Uncharacterized protein n=1 Tax=Globodera rostochiensis TaxID=31243 RepID=A0A914HGB0_GLORO